MKGYLFKIRRGLNTTYYFYEVNTTRKSKAIAKKFVDYIANAVIAGLTNAGFPPTPISPVILESTLDKIYNEMEQVEIIKSNEYKCYHIHSKYSGETIPDTALIIIV